VVVRSPHSCTAKPHTMEEVRRILRLHAGLATAAAPREDAAAANASISPIVVAPASTGAISEEP